MYDGVEQNRTGEPIECHDSLEYIVLGVGAKGTE